MDNVLSVLTTIGIIFGVVMLFNFMIFVHELGHFFAARWRGLYVDRFQIWFGRPIWKKTINGVQWGLGWIPAGGFVSLPQMAPMEAIEGSVELPKDLKPVKPLDKIIVAAAGPVASFLLAVLFGVTLRLVLAFFPFDVWQQHNFYIFALSSLQAGVVINFGLGWLNLVPIPPLDGSKVVAYFLPGETAWRYLSMERYGFIILLLLLFTGALGYVLGPLVSGSARGLLSLLGLL